MEKDVMTPDHDRWEEFAKRLEGPDGWWRGPRWTEGYRAGRTHNIPVVM